MRRVALLTAFAALFLCADARAGQPVPASGTAGFMAWAIAKASDCDSSWTSMTGRKVLAPRPEPRDADDAPSALPEGARTRLDWPPLGDVEADRSKLSHRIIDSRNFVHMVGGDFPFMQGLVRKRNDPSRGVNPLEHPASTVLAVPHDALRPLNSSTQQRTYFHSFGEVSRPRLGAFGRLPATGERRFNATPARPYCRASRPRLL